MEDLLRGRVVACAESCTAGAVCAELAAIGGASDWLRGGLVAYQETVKRALLGVRAESVLTEEAAREMALGVARLLDAQVAVSTTGVVGDTPEDGVEPGTVIIATLVDGDVDVSRHRFDGRPQDRCALAARTAVRRLTAHLERRCLTAVHDG